MARPDNTVARLRPIRRAANRACGALGYAQLQSSASAHRNDAALSVTIWRHRYGILRRCSPALGGAVWFHGSAFVRRYSSIALALWALALPYRGDYPFHVISHPALARARRRMEGGRLARHAGRKPPISATKRAPANRIATRTFLWIAPDQASTADDPAFYRFVRAADDVPPSQAEGIEKLRFSMRSKRRCRQGPRTRSTNVKVRSQRAALARDALDFSRHSKDATKLRYSMAGANALLPASPPCGGRFVLTAWEERPWAASDHMRALRDQSSAGLRRRLSHLIGVLRSTAAAHGSRSKTSGAASAGLRRPSPTLPSDSAIF